MITPDVPTRIKREIKNLFPLFRYLILQTETHAFCLALACAALLGFYPSCLVLLAFLKNILRWPTAYDVLLNTVRLYYPYPADPDFVAYNLGVSVEKLGGRVEFSSLVWILLGAAGVFIPLEAGFNRLWQVTEDRPYWLNQLVGFVLTILCACLALLSVSISTGFRLAIAFLPFEVLQKTSNYAVIRLSTICFFIVTIFAFYKFLPNRKIDSMQVLPAAILAGIIAEIVRMIYALVLPFLDVRATQGPFVVSVSFVLLAYVETFVVLGGAFLATRTDRYPWMGFLRSRAQ